MSANPSPNRKPHQPSDPQLPKYDRDKVHPVVKRYLDIALEIYEDICSNPKRRKEFLDSISIDKEGDSRLDSEEASQYEQ